MNVSVLVTCFNEEENIRECLGSLINQGYDAGAYEIIVVDGGSKDTTQHIVKGFEGTYPNVTLVVEPKRGTAAGRNAGVRASRYDYVAFIDADCVAPLDWLATLVGHYKHIKSRDDRVIAVGGTNFPPENSSRFLRAIGTALDSYIGSFNSVQGRQFKGPHYVSSLSNLNVLYDKQKIIDIGFYDESLNSEAEDADINFRLFSAGYRFLFHPDSFVWHKMRPTPRTWLRNMFRYGKGRARLLKRYPQMWTISYVLPLFFAAGISTLFLIPLFTVFSLSALYFPAILCLSLLQCLKKKASPLVLHVVLVYLIQHFGYAAGEMYGLIHPQVK